MPLAGPLAEAEVTKPKKRAKKDREGLAVIAGKRSFEPSSLVQKNLLEQSFGAKRFAYNWGLAEQERRREAGLSSSFESLRNALNAVKKEQFPWMYDVPKDVVAEGVRDLTTAFQNFFSSHGGQRKGKKVGYPKPKKRGRCRFAFRLPGDRVKITDSVVAPNGHTLVKSIKLSTLGHVRLDEPLELCGKITQVNVSRSGEKYYISFSMEYKPTTRVRMVRKPKSIGGDLGLGKTLVLSNGKVIQGPRAFMKLSKRLAKEQRRLSRMPKGSKNRKKQAQKVAAIHAKIACIRKDFVEKTSTYLLRKYDIVCLETLNVSGMMRNHKLASSLADASFGAITAAVKRKQTRLGSLLMQSPMFFASSKQCSKCKVKNQDLTLSDRIFRCVNPDCNHVMDRDLNAAINIHKECLKKIPRAAGKFTPMEIWSLPSFCPKQQLGKTKTGSGNGLSKDTPSTNVVPRYDSAQICSPGTESSAGEQV